jgi:hypothetical protein
VGVVEWALAEYAIPQVGDKFRVRKALYQEVCLPSLSTRSYTRTLSSRAFRLFGVR